MIDLNLIVKLEERRCFECGCWYAHEAYRNAGCPRCIGRQRYEDRREMDRLRRVVASLRGALTRAKAGR